MWLYCLYSPPVLSLDSLQWCYDFKLGVSELENFGANSKMKPCIFGIYVVWGGWGRHWESPSLTGQEELLMWLWFGPPFLAQQNDIKAECIDSQFIFMPTIEKNVREASLSLFNK